MTKADSMRINKLTQISSQICKIEEEIATFLLDIQSIHKKISATNDEDLNYEKCVLLAKIVNAERSEIAPLLEQRRILVDELRNVFFKTHFIRRKEIKEEFGF